MLVPRSVDSSKKLEKHVISSTSFVQKLLFFSFSPVFCEIQDLKAFFAIKNLSGFTCLRFGWPTEYLKPVNGGINRACRGTSGIDNQPHYYRVAKARLLEDCKSSMCSCRSFVMGSNSAWGAVKSGNVYPNTRPVWKVLVVFSYSPQNQGPLAALKQFSTASTCKMACRLRSSFLS